MQPTKSFTTWGQHNFLFPTLDAVCYKARVLSWVCVLQTQLWQMSPWTSCVCWWRTSGAGCAQRTYRKPLDSSLAPSLRGRICFFFFFFLTITGNLLSVGCLWRTDTCNTDRDWSFLEHFSFRWLEVGVAHLTSAPCWVIYLQVLQEAVWPGGTLPAQPRPERSAEEREETKEQCLNCLVKLLPGIRIRIKAKSMLFYAVTLLEL